MFAWQKWGIKPDIMLSAKALGCGVPVGAFMMTEKVGQSSLVPGDHGTTYGGNPLAAAAVSKVMDIFAEDGILNRVNKTAPYLEKRLEELVSEYECISERRGTGLMQGLKFDRPVADIIVRCMDKGLIIINAGADILRFVPSLIIEESHIDEMIDILRETIEESLHA